MTAAWLQGEPHYSGWSDVGSASDRPELLSLSAEGENGESDGTGSFPPACAVAPHPDELLDGLMGEVWPL